MTAPSGPIVDVSWLREHQADANLVIADLRPFEQYLNGHIPGAIPLDIMGARLLSSAPEAVTRWHEAVQGLFRAAGITQETVLVAYEDISGTSAAYAVWLADVARLAGAAMLDGGFNAWLASGGEVTGDPAQPAPSDFTLEPCNDVVATAQDLADAIGSGTPLQIVDTRSDQEFAGATIPGARHLEWTRALNRDGTLRPADEIRADYVARGIDLDADAPIATFCGSGLRAAHAYVVLRHLGAKQPRNYGPSWSEWGRHPQTPKVRPDVDEI